MLNNTSVTKNCKNSAKCSIVGECLKFAVFLRNHVADRKLSVPVIGMTDHTYKTRYNAHTSFRHESQRLSTELSKKVWEPKAKEQSTI